MQPPGSSPSSRLLRPDHHATIPEDAAGDACPPPLPGSSRAGKGDVEALGSAAVGRGARRRRHRQVHDEEERFGESDGLAAASRRAV
ncbi:Os10g0400850 [Oryza sativa Japonica Group]|uniref:Os10g0400850 protein n=1 Tax=Oryza sativa subsp. japonica TaxID=39947 RepID=A0A0P0XUE5_ORYSJ|nr:Os10g0400850 [Oryza sativa Japonica Group]